MPPPLTLRRKAKTMTSKSKDFNTALAETAGQQVRQVQAGTPPGNPNAAADWHAAIGGVQAPGTLPSERAQNTWLAAMSPNLPEAEMAAMAAMAAKEERAAREEAAERAQLDKEWAEHQAATFVSPAEKAARAEQAKARSEREQAEREAAHQRDVERAQREIDAMWARRERATGAAP